MSRLGALCDSEPEWAYLLRYIDYLEGVARDFVMLGGQNAGHLGSSRPEIGEFDPEKP